MATTAELIEKLHKCAEWFEHHGRNTNTAVIGICKQAAVRLETLYNERMAAADEIDRVEAKYKALLEKAKADMPHYCSTCAFFIVEGRGCKRDYKCAWKWRGEE